MLNINFPEMSIFTNKNYPTFDTMLIGAFTKCTFIDALKIM